MCDFPIVYNSNMSDFPKLPSPPASSIYPPPQAGQQFPNPVDLPTHNLNQGNFPGGLMLPVPQGGMPIPQVAQGNMPYHTGINPGPQGSNPYPQAMQPNPGYLPSPQVAGGFPLPNKLLPPGPSNLPLPSTGPNLPLPSGGPSYLPLAPRGLPLPPGGPPLPPGGPSNFLVSNFPGPGQLPGFMPGPQPINPQNPMNFPPPSAPKNQFSSIPSSSPDAPAYINPSAIYGAPGGNIPQYPPQGIYPGNPGLPYPMVPPNGGGRGMQPPGYAPVPQQALQERTIHVKPSILQIIQQHNMHATIIDADPNVYFDFQGNKLKITARPEHIEEIVRKMQNLQARLDSDPNARWACLQNDGQYMLYEPQITNTIESAYQHHIPELLRPVYVNYSRSICITAGGAQYEIQFAQMGGVHRQIKRQGADTIRAVRRQANGEDLNKDFVRNYKWLWKHEGGEFRPYEDDAIFLIEHSYIEWKNAGGHTSQNKRIALIQGCNGNTYQIEYATMRQFNEITGYPRHIKREPSD